MNARAALFAAAASLELVLLHAAAGHGDFAKRGEVLAFVPLMLLAGVAFFGAVRWFAAVPSLMATRTLWALAIGMRLVIASPHRATIGWAVTLAWRGSSPGNGEPSSNQERGAAAPHSVWRCGSRKVQRMEESSSAAASISTLGVGVSFAA